MFKSGYVTIIGRPNVGKSTLLNHLMGEKLSIVSNKPQTTRNNIQTILTTKEQQIIFVDTPGIHKPGHKLGEYMVKLATDSLVDVDVVLFLTTPDVELGKGDKFILDQLKETKTPVVLVLNKIDETIQDRIAQSLKNYSQYFDFSEIVPISALKGKNTEVLTEVISKYLPEGPQYYPADMITDQQEKFIVGETIREKALRLLSEEVPHGIAVEIISMKKNDKGKYEINADIICEKDSHKGIIIGKAGAMLKKIKKYSTEDLEKFLSSKIELNLWVKVRKEWRDKQEFLKDMGYK